MSIEYICSSVVLYSLGMILQPSLNHYAGFDPGTANTLRKMLDLSEIIWNDVEVSQTEEELNRSSSSSTKRTTLSDFLK